MGPIGAYEWTLGRARTRVRTLDIAASRADAVPAGHRLHLVPVENRPGEHMLQKVVRA